MSIDAVASRIGPSAPEEAHVVQFYEDESFLAETVAKFLGQGIGAGDPVVVIATETHRATFCDRLRNNAVDVDAARSNGQLTLLDARETLATFMVDGAPDWDRFHATLGKVLDDVSVGRAGCVVRAYGEMVDLLWRDGDRVAAIRLEELWNELGRSRSFNLLCAYVMDNFYKEGDAEQFARICEVHTHARPTEKYAQITDDVSRQREITILQQRALALNNEVERRKKLEAELRRSEQRLSEFVEEAVVPLHWVGSDGIIIWANKAELSMLGYSREEYVGQHIAKFHDDAQAIDDMLARLSRYERLREYPSRLRCKDGSIRYVLVDSHVRMEDGKFAHTCCFTRDITSRMEAEQAALLAAQRANRAKDEFLAMLGHELRNPLAPIVTALQLMKLRGDMTQTKEQIIIERQVQHLVRLVDDLLDVSRIAQKKIELKTETFELATVVAQAVEIASPLVERRHHNLSVEVPRQGMRITGDPMRLAQVIANLLTNAAKYTDEDGRIELSAWRDGHEVVLQVKDNGIGIRPDLLPNVFDLFVQGPRSLDRSEGGLGIGLTLVKTLVQLHGGTVMALSDGPGKGSVFVVRLPTAAQSDHAAPTARPLNLVRPPVPRRVLIVDDNEDAATLLAEMCASMGHDVRVAYDGPQTLTLLEEFRPDVAVLDIGLPVMDGYELAKRLREQLGAECRLIALTGYGQEHDRRRSEEAGFEAHLVKPVDPSRVLRMIDGDHPGP